MHVATIKDTTRFPKRYFPLKKYYIFTRKIEVECMHFSSNELN